MPEAVLSLLQRVAIGVALHTDVTICHGRALRSAAQHPVVRSLLVVWVMA